MNRFPLLLALLLGLTPPAAAATRVNADPLEMRLASELAQSLGSAVPPSARVTVALGVPFTGPVEAVRDLTYDPRTGAIRALVASNGRLIELGGKAEIAVDVPVPSRRVNAGEVLAQSDIAFIPMPIERIADGVLTDGAALVGMEARRQLTAGRLIHRGSVGAPLVVQRNKPVVVRFVDGALQLEARGRALQDGGVGDLVKVMNVASSAVVTGTVTGPNAVQVHR